MYLFRKENYPTMRSNPIDHLSYFIWNSQTGIMSHYKNIQTHQERQTLKSRPTIATYIMIYYSWGLYHKSAVFINKYLPCKIRVKLVFYWVGAFFSAACFVNTHWVVQNYNLRMFCDTKSTLTDSHIVITGILTVFIFIK